MKQPAKLFSFLLGPLLFVVFAAFVHPAGMSDEARWVLAATLWIAVWWITEAIPIPATSLLPLILFPMCGIMPVKEAAQSYGDPIVFLYLGGFVIAIAIERWGLHRRIALNTILRTGTNQRSIVLGFMISTAFVSMWISNTATAVMMLPIGKAMISQLPGQGTSDFGKALMLSIAYAATIGGMATLIGTPTNLVFAGIVRETYGTEITFLQWLSIGFPLMVILLFLSWLYLTRIGFKMAKGTRAAEDEDIRSMVRTMGKMTYAEKAVSVVFLVTALCWILRSFVLEKLIPEIDDSVIAIAGALLLFMIPSRAEEGGRIMDWKAASAIPWGIILLFGGGLSVAAAFQSSGLAGWMGNQLALLQGVPLFLLILFLVTGVTILSEIASNVATAAMILPVLVALAAAIGVHPFILMVAATLGASCGFMLPVATPPNAVVFGSGYLKIRDMMRAGLWMDILCVLIVSIFIYLFLEIFWKALLV